MKYTLFKGERLLVAILINNLPGVNRTDGRLVSKVHEHLVLAEVQMGTMPIPVMEDKSEYELAELEALWIMDHINKSFEKSQVPPNLAKYAFSLEDKLKVDEPEEEPDKPAKKK